MKEKMKKFFSNSDVLFICGVLAVCSWIIWGIAVWIIEAKLESTIDAIFYVGLILGLIMAYRKGETNIQKALLGALFILLCTTNVKILFDFITLKISWLIILYLVTFLLTILSFVGHLLQQSDHLGKNISLIINQCMGLMAIIIALYGLKQAAFTDVFPTTDVTFIIAWFLTVVLIICLETRINTYKEIRAEAKEAGVWNEQTRQEAKEIFKI